LTFIKLRYANDVPVYTSGLVSKDTTSYNTVPIYLISLPQQLINSDYVLNIQVSYYSKDIGRCN